MAAKETPAVKRVRVPLVGQLSDYRSPPTVLVSTSAPLGQHFINCLPYTEINPYTKQPRYYVKKRPGAKDLFADLTDGSYQVYNGDTFLYRASGGGWEWDVVMWNQTNTRLKRITSGGVVSTATTQSVTIEPCIVNITGSADTMVTDRNTVAAYYANGTTAITDVDFPLVAGLTTVGRFVELNGRIYVMTTTGRIYNSDLNSLSSWGATNYLTTQTQFDGRGLARYKNYIVAFSNTAMEFYKDIGNTSGSPLALVPELTSHVGAYYANALAPDHMTAGPRVLEFNNTIYWIGKELGGTLALYTLEDFKPKRLSNAYIDRFLSGQVSSNSRRDNLFAINIWSKPHIGIRIHDWSPTNERTLMYNIEDNAWWEWEGATANKYIIGGAHGKVVLSDGVTVATLSDDTVTDESEQDDTGSNFTMRVITNPLDISDHNRIFIDRISILGDGDTTAGTISIVIYDDQRAASTARTMTLNGPGETNFGAWRRPRFDIRYTGAQRMRWEALEIQYRDGIH
jgi:hypothetical protein